MDIINPKHTIQGKFKVLLTKYPTLIRKQWAFLQHGNLNLCGNKKLRKAIALSMLGRKETNTYRQIFG